MKIVVFSSTFLPSIGGLEMIMAGLATEWAKVGHEVIVFTLTDQTRTALVYPYKVIRKTSLKQLHREVATANIYVEANFSFKNCFVGLLNTKKWFIVHHTPYDHKSSIIGFLKSKFCRVARNISVSKFIADKIGAPSKVIHNFYSPIFYHTQQFDRIYDFVFVGRLVSDKGVDRLCKALFSINWTGKCIIVGDGNERSKLESIVETSGFSNQINFLGTKTQGELLGLLNQSKVMIIPSLWDEPFGVVALEGMACGCTIACSNKRGLVEATDGLALFFDPERNDSIAETLQKALAFTPESSFVEKVSNHLRMHNRDTIAKQYISLFENSSL